MIQGIKVNKQIEKWQKRQTNRPYWMLWFGILISGYGWAAVDETRLDKQALSETTIPFVRNQGQLDHEVAFVAQTFTGPVYVTHDGRIVTDVSETVQTDDMQRRSGVAIHEKVVTEMPIVVTGQSRSAIQVNHITGPDASIFTPDVYRNLSLGEIYPGISLKLQAKGHNVEKLYHVAAGSDPMQISMSLEGQRALSVNPNGLLQLETEHGDILYSAPVAWQTIDGVRRDISVVYQLQGTSRYGFELGQYDPDHELIIDPLIAGTFIGSTQRDEITEVASLGGDVYIAGLTENGSFPTTPGAYNETITNGNTAWFVSRLSPDLSTLVASTFIGNNLFVDGIAFNATEMELTSNAVYLMGRASSGSLPVSVSSFDGSFNGASDLYLARLNLDLSMLTGSTYLGGTEQDYGYDMDHDPSNDSICVTGYTLSTDFPVTAGVHDTTFNGSNDVFVSCLSGDLGSLLKSTYLGDVSSDIGHAIETFNGLVWVAGTTGSNNFPTLNGFQNSPIGSSDGFVTLLFNDFSILASTFVGTTSNDTIQAIELSGGSIYAVTTANTGIGIDTSGGADSSHNGAADVLVIRMQSLLSTFQNASFYGSNGIEAVHDLKVDANGDVYVYGRTTSTALPTSIDAFQSFRTGFDDAFVAVFNSTLTSLDYATYLRADLETGRTKRFALAAPGSLYLPARASATSNVIVTPGAFSTTVNGSGDEVDGLINHLIIDGSVTQVSAGSSLVTIDTDENEASVTIDVMRTGNLAGVTVLNYSTSDITAMAGQDYQSEFGSLRWNPGEGDTRQIIINLIDDEIDELDEQFGFQLNAVAGATIALFGGSRTINITDNDMAGVLVSPTSGLEISELPDMAQFDVSLLSEPANPPVNITFSSTDTTEGQLMGAMPNGDLNLSFDAGNWNIPQAVMVSSVDDDVDDGDQPFTVLGLQIVNPDPFYNGINVDDVDLTTIDDDTAGFEYTPVGDPLVTTEAGGIDNFNLRLTSEPEANVGIGLSLDSNGVGEGMISPISLMFTAANWDSFQPVTVTGVDDMIIDGDQQYNILVNASSSDPNYVFIAEPGPLVVNLDDDAISTDLSVTVTNNVNQVTPGEAITYSVVVSNLSSEDVFAAPVSSSSLNLPESMISWTCGPLIGVATCLDATGSGQIMTTVATTSGASVMFTVTAMAANMPNQQAEFSVQVDVPAGFSDSNPVDNFDMDSDLIFVEDIFEDGFETP